MLKRLFIPILSATVALLISVEPARAQGDAAVLTPLLEWWQQSQMGQMFADAETALNTWASLLDNVENTGQLVDMLKKTTGAIQKYKRVKSQVEAVYYNNKNLYETCVYAYQWAQEKLNKGEITIADATKITLLIDYIYRRATSNFTEIIDLITDDNSGLSAAEGEAKVQEIAEGSKADAEAIEGIIEEQEEMERITAESKHFLAMLQSAYGTAGENDGIVMPTKQDAKQDLDNIIKEDENASEDKKTFSSDKGKAIEHNIKELRQLDESILNVVCVIIGVLAIIMAIPAYIRVNHGQQQSKDALYKLFMGTVAIIFIIQVFGRLLFTLFK